jgi:CheY-like chemotaxis protein
MNAPQRDQPLILVVDQDQAVVDAISSLVAAAGFACHCCLTAEAALEAAPVLRPDLIIADVSLQGLSGLELCQQIKQDEALAEVPVMFLSAGQVPDIIRRRDAGQASYFLRKPFAPEVLAELIEQAIGLPRELVDSGG